MEVGRAGRGVKHSRWCCEYARAIVCLCPCPPLFICACADCRLSTPCPLSLTPLVRVWWQACACACARSCLSVPAHTVIHLCLCLLLLTPLTPLLPLLMFVPPHLCPLGCMLACACLGLHIRALVPLVIYACLFGFYLYSSVLGLCSRSCCDN